MRALLTSISLALLSLGCGLDPLSSCDYGYTSLSSGAEIAIKSTTLGGSSIAQSFSLPHSDEGFLTLQNVRLYFKRTGSFDTEDTITASIVADSSSIPDTTILSSGNVLISTLSDSDFVAKDIALSSAVSLTTETTYWITITASYPQSDTDLVEVRAHQGSSGEYTSGQALYETSTPGSWSSLLIGDFRDLNFQFNCAN